MTAAQAQDIIDAFRVGAVALNDITTQHFMYRVVSTEGLRAILTADQKTYLNSLVGLNAGPFV